MRPLFLLSMFALAASAQSMLEMGGIAAGSAIGSAAGKKLSDGVNKNMRKADSVLKKAAKQTPASGVPSAPPALQVSPGVPRSRGYNVPPPPPPKQAAAPAPRTPVRTTRVSVPIVMSAVAPAPEPVNVDLSSIEQGMKREALLAKGDPSARITSSEDGHLLETFYYRNATFASGRVRLRDGAVYSVEARP